LNVLKSSAILRPALNSRLPLETCTQLSDITDPKRTGDRFILASIPVNTFSIFTDKLTVIVQGQTQQVRCVGYSMVGRGEALSEGDWTKLRIKKMHN